MADRPITVILGSQSMRTTERQNRAAEAVNKAIEEGLATGDL